MTSKRVKSGLAVTEEHLRLCDENLRRCDARSRNDFVEQAIEFYASYLNTQQMSDQLGDALTRELGARLSQFTKTFSTNQYKLSVLVTALCHLMTSEHEYAQHELPALLEQCCAEVKAMGSAPDFCTIARNNF